MLARWAFIVVLIVGCTKGASLPAAPDDFSVHEFDWPQWQGPDRTAVSKETGLLKTWPKDGPPLLWKATGCGEGFV
ncbi:MAG TPA: hypothetical protein VE988_01635, partial [Gemmataceae bacterium]|nr:hypothetical protein [Gemmataceae bacterium]